MRSIVIKLGLTILFLFIMVLFPLGFVVDRVFSNFYYQTKVQELKEQSRKIVSVMIDNADADNAQIILGVLKLTNNQVYLLDATGRIVVETDDTDRIDHALSREEWEMLTRGVMIAKEVTLSGERFVLVANPVMKEQTFSGAVFLTSPLEGIRYTLDQVRKFLFLSVAGAVLLAAGFTILLARKLSFPLLEMERATRKIAEGDLQVRVTQTSNDEIGSLAEAINDLASSLKRIQDTRSEFFANISHELRTPMTYIEGYIRLLQEEMTAQDQEKRTEIVNIILIETRRLKGLVNDLFDLAQLEEGKIALALEWIDLSEVIERVGEKVSLRAKSKGLSLTVHEEDVPLMQLDGSRMQQILLNLLDNAIRYTEKGTISISLENRIKFIRIVISDTGIGIPEQDIPLIFERFHRVEKSRSREFGGTGLGLAIVKRLVELQGGTIEVESKLGAGTTFSIIFPVTLEEKMA